MTSRQRPWPRAWLMTDERMGARLWTAIDRLPVKLAGIVFRHYLTPPDERSILAKRIADICHRRTLTLAIAEDADHTAASFQALYATLTARERQ